MARLADVMTVGTLSRPRWNWRWSLV